MADHDETKAPGMMPSIDDDDVEGHAAPQHRALEPDGIDPIDEGDVEGHRGGMTRADGGPDDFGQTRVSRPRIDDDEDDVEGHFGYVKGPSTRGE